MPNYTEVDLTRLAFLGNSLVSAPEGSVKLTQQMIDRDPSDPLRPTLLVLNTALREADPMDRAQLQTIADHLLDDRDELTRYGGFTIARAIEVIGSKPRRVPHRP